MQRKTLALMLKGIVLLIVAIAALFYVLIIPDIISQAADISAKFTPYAKIILIAIDISAIPILTALFSFYRICTAIAKDDSFCQSNVVRLNIIAVCAFIDTAYCLIATIVLSLLRLLTIEATVFSIAVMLVGVAITVAASLLSHLVEKVRIIQQDVDLTI